jgi:hypothetical protein
MSQPETGMSRHTFLQGLHAATEPRTYLEIGINDGKSMALSSTRSIGVDPAFRVTVEIACDVQLVRATSDDFFARQDPLAWFRGDSIDLGFVDGLHLFEQALRDFINVERFCSPTSVVVFDDMLPRAAEEASRERTTRFWAGDVFKVATVLERYRPDLLLIPLDTAPTGLLLVLGMNPADRTLAEHFDDIVAEFATPDPQSVPSEILERTRAADPRRVIASTVWADIRRSRVESGELPATASTLLELLGTGRRNLSKPVLEPWPPAKPTPTKKAAGPSAARPPRPRWRAGLRRVVRAVERRL